jgi:hypothetical protein
VALIACRSHVERRRNRPESAAELRTGGLWKGLALWKAARRSPL